MSILREAQESMRSMRDEFAAVDVGYLRADMGQAKPIRATPAITTVTVDDGNSLIVKTKVYDWLIEVEQLFGYQTPMAGDRILFDDKTYVVADVGSEHCWRWHGTLGKTYRVHTKQIPHNKGIQ